MKVSTLLRSTCIASALLLASGCVTGPSKPELTPAQKAIAAMSYDQKAEKFLEIIHADKLATPAYMQAHAMLEQLFSMSKSAQAKRAVLETYGAKADAILDKAVGWNVLKPEMIKLYSSAFTDAELGQMIEFYQSPTGQKMLKKLPEVTMQADQLIRQKVVQGVAPQMNELFGQMAKELGVSLKRNAR